MMYFSFVNNILGFYYEFVCVYKYIYIWLLVFLKKTDAYGNLKKKNGKDMNDLAARSNKKK